MEKEHYYHLTVEWTGNTGTGTSGYRACKRDHTVAIDGKQELHCSSDPAFRGDAARHNPEDLLLASLASCHMLWYLHLCADAGVVVIAYTDRAKGTMTESEDDGGQFTSVTLYPEVVVANEAMSEKARELHARARELCFIARSVNFPVHHEPSVKVV